MKNISVVNSRSEKETFNFAKKFAKTLKSGDILLLKGDLGAGKTAFTKGIAKGFKIKDEVVSPTFTIMNIYGGGKLQHYDLYRLDSFEEFRATGAYEMLFMDAISVIEWPEKVGLENFPSESIVIEIIKMGENNRQISIYKNGDN